MNIIAISDIYSDVNIIQEFTQFTSKNKKPIIIVVGDIGIGTSPRYKQEVEYILSLLSKISSQTFYIAGDSDSKQFEVSTPPNVKNLDGKYHVINDENVKIGLLGLGGAPLHSMRNTELSPYLWDESIPMVAENLLTGLKINIEKIAQEHPDYIILVTHSPPYGIADRSKPITLQETLVLRDILEELEGEEKTEIKPRAGAKKTISIRHLGSRVLSDFVKYYKPDIHIFGHVHKEGGKIEIREATKFFNISHISSLPYKLTGRKFLTMKLTREDMPFSFNHLVSSDLPFSEFVNMYL